MAVTHAEVSVVIAAYNAARFIKQAIDSALAQSLAPAEIIVVDDGSTDHTREVLARYGERVRYFYQNNAGPGAARNRGVREARGDWVAFLDSDDFWDKNHLELLLNHAREFPEAVLIYCGKKWVDLEGREIQGNDKQKMFPSGWIFSDMFAGNYISTTSVVVAKKAILTEVGGFEERLKVSQDYDLWLRIAAVAPICGLPVYTLNYRRHDSNLTLQAVKMYKEDISILMEAIKMILNGKVDSRNNPRAIDIRVKMRQSFTNASVGMFHIGEYKEVRGLGWRAIRCGYATVPLVPRWVLSWLPGRVLNHSKRVIRYWRRSDNKPDFSSSNRC